QHYTLSLHDALPICATLVYESQGQRYRNETASGNQSTNLVKTLNGATNVTANSLYETNLIRSMLARVTYDYDGRYLFTASIRRRSEEHTSELQSREN